MKSAFVSALLILFSCASVYAQTSGSLRGVVSDETGAILPGAKVTATGPGGARTATATIDGSYVISGLAPGTYRVQATSPGLVQGQPATVDIAAGARTLNLQLRVASEKEEVTVQESVAATVTTDPSSNAGQLVLKTEDLQSLSDDPDDLQQDLQALAGPSAGPDGGQIYIDGFTDGRMPPKESIREVRINSNPFSSEYDRLGYGRIEIFTKPGTDKLRGTVFFNISDGVLNSRNPYLTSNVTPPFQTRQYGGNLSGALGKKASFFLDAERRDIDDVAVINAQIVDPQTFQVQPFSSFQQAPQRRTTVSPRVDYQLTPKHTLMMRYSYLLNDQTDNGVGGFSLVSRAYNYEYQQHTVQLTDTWVVGPTMINETRFQYRREDTLFFGNNSLPALNVVQAFNSGGAQVGNYADREDHYELQNYSTISRGNHTRKFGIRVRTIDLGNTSPMNFGGTFSFTGGLAPELDADNNPVLDAGGNPVLVNIGSLERYRRTLLFQSEGLSAARIRALGGGASQFTLSAGNPFLQLNQTDLGFFYQDDWRLRPNLTVSLGLRWEWQTNISDHKDFGPRVGFAWSPSANNKTVIRGGFGMFYSRFNDTFVLNSERYDGITQQQYIATNPDFFPDVPPLAALQQQITSRTTIDPNLRAPYVIQAAAGVERQLPFKSTLAVTFTNTRGDHLFVARDINAPLPGTFSLAVPGSGVRPYGNVGEIYQYESDGILNQHQLIVNLNMNGWRNVTLFTGYVLNYAKSNTDGSTNSITYPANPYDLAADYGRSSLDVRNRLYLGGSYTTRWNIRLSPFVIASSGRPFNIYESRDLYGDGLINTARPAFAANPNAPGMVVTSYGVFDPNPQPGEQLIPRNLGNSPGFFSLNLRVSKTFGIGGEKNGRPRSAAGGGGGGRGGPPGGRFGGFGGGGPRGGMGGGDALTSHRYNLVVGVQARNLLNNNNPGPVIGDITSPYFGASNTLAGGFGPVANPANNRRIEFQMRFLF